MNPKRIGSGYERDVAKKLSEWMSGNSEDLVCWRTAGSGSVGTIRKKKGLAGSNIESDFQCIDSKYEEFFNLFFIDSKCYKEFNPFIINTKNIKSNSIFNQWLKVVSDCPSNKYPIMICKIRDRQTPEFVVVSNKMKYNFTNKMEYSILINNSFVYFTIITLDDFLKNNEWNILLNQGVIA